MDIEEMTVNARVRLYNISGALILPATDMMADIKKIDSRILLVMNVEVHVGGKPGINVHIEGNAQISQAWTS